MIIKIRDFIYIFRNLEVKKWQDKEGGGLYGYWVKIGFRLHKLAVRDKKIKNIWDKVKMCWELSDYYTIRENEVYVYSLDNKNTFYRH